ncbi:DUF2007 domain-containing protein [Pelovirga terrestris]|uniref:DUF2007 domain-containing protein n=1 Tax=Pelovirga terrestris TaxID=2771352 RepID=A0A8J6QY28_9BACT|nr:DUF2007 domain-containing protein [Pelovirga terrestris]MBD1401391.1 DUF2007 domain-containing protein [Pelovirga terrestris]
MKKLHVFGFHEAYLAGLLRDILIREEIDCVLRNVELTAAVGEIPFIECCPELWVVDNEAWPRAKMFVDAWLKKDPLAPAWRCPQCQETLEGHFGACWRCGCLRVDG